MSDDQSQGGAEAPKVKIIVLKDFKFAHGGIRVEEFVASKKPIDTTEECAELAISEGWAKPAEGGRKAANSPNREQLDEALDALPGAYTDAELVVSGMRSHFGDLFSAADEARVRELVKAST